MVDQPVVPGEQPPRTRRRLNPRAARSLGVLVVVGALVDLVVQNSQRVAIRFLVVTGHVRLIWVILVCVVVAGGVGYLAGRRGGRRRRRRRAEP